jgi:hypothetical protein
MLAVGAALLLAKVLGIDVVGAVTDSLVPTANLEKANGKIADKAKEIKAANEENLVVSKENNKEQDKALKALEDTLVKLEQNAQFEKDKVNLGEAQANIKKAIAEEEAKLEKVGKSLSDNDKKRITDAYTSIQATKEQVSMTKVLEGLETERLGLAETDKNQREIVLAIRKQELEYKRALTESEKQSLTESIKKTQETRAQEIIGKSLKSLEEERLLLAIEDKDQREITAAILKTQQDIGRVLTQQEQQQLSASIKLTQQKREQAAIAESIRNYTRDQTELEKINRGISLQGTLDPMSGAKKEYTKDKEALQSMLDQKLISEQQYYAQREELSRQYNQKVQDLELKRIETVLMAERSGMAATMSDKDRALLQQVGANERQKAIVDERIKFEKKSEMEKVGFALEQGAVMFNALGAQNKKAFEAAKAFNLANAIMNTYMAVTKALATYPFPFSLIAAGGALAFGLAQVAQIRSQSYSGRALGGPVMGGQPYMVGESGPELFTPSTTGSITRNGDLPDGKTVNVNFTIVANDTTGFDQLLASRKGVITQIINDAVLEKGKRSIA